MRAALVVLALLVQSPTRGFAQPGDAAAEVSSTEPSSIEASSTEPSSIAPGYPSQAAPTRVWLALGACDDRIVRLQELAALLRVELSSQGVVGVMEVESAASPNPSDAEIEIDCSPESTSIFNLRVRHHGTGNSLERRLDLSGIAVLSNSRALALAVAEVIRASWSALATAESIDDVASAPVETRFLTEQLTPPEVEELALASLEKEPSVSAAPTLGAAFLAESFPSGAVGFLGAQVDTLIPFAEQLAIAVALQAGYSEVVHRLGRVGMGFVGLNVGLEYRIVISESFRVHLGPHLSARAAWAWGRAYESGATTNTALGPVVLAGGQLAFAVSIAHSIDWTASVAADGVLYGFRARASGERVAALEGAALSTAIGARLRF